MDELDALLVLNAVGGIGNVSIYKLLNRFGSAKKVLSLNETELVNSHILHPKTVNSLQNFSKDEFLKNEFKLIKSNNISIISYNNTEYPLNLQEIYNAPVVIYSKGAIPDQINYAIAIVGMRKASFYGMSIAEKFSMRLTDVGLTIVSGMARGIDTAAHRGVLKAKGSTVAVLGCGLSHVYPPENEGLLERIAGNGAVISEFSMQTPPIATNFPRRNRIISGLSLGVIVIEAAMRSGSLITADFALEQGREVYAIPGKIDSPNSLGVNNLIKQGAKLVSCVEDVLEDFKPQIEGLIKKRNYNESDNADDNDIDKLTDEERLVYSNIKRSPVHIDEIAAKCQFSSSAITSVLLKLELKKYIRQVPGKLFVK